MLICSGFLYTDAYSAFYSVVSALEVVKNCVPFRTSGRKPKVGCHDVRYLIGQLRNVNIKLQAVLRIRIQDEQPGSYLRELKNNFLGYLT
jgi:hypothetical protein